MKLINLGFDSQSLKVVPKLNKGMILVRKTNSHMITKIDRTKDLICVWNEIEEVKYSYEDVRRDIQFGHIKVGQPDL